MRPIAKGPVPQIGEKPKVVKHYQEWREDLRMRIGRYCCYCNIPLLSGAHVEHVFPKNPPEGVIKGSFLDWDNMLFACINCNSSKGNTPIADSLFFLPEVHNTHLAFEYRVIAHPFKLGQKACVPIPSQYSLVDSAKARRTIDLLKLDDLKHDKGEEKDLRWHYRHQALLIAEQWKRGWDEIGHFQANNFIPLLLTAATAKGFFSIWMQVFSNVPQICLALIDAFPGTAKDCFDPNGHPIPRNGTEI